MKNYSINKDTDKFYDVLQKVNEGMSSDVLVIPGYAGEYSTFILNVNTETLFPQEKKFEVKFARVNAKFMKEILLFNYLEDSFILYWWNGSEYIYMFFQTDKFHKCVNSIFFWENEISHKNCGILEPHSWDAINTASFFNYYPFIKINKNDTYKNIAENKNNLLPSFRVTPRSVALISKNKINKDLYVLPYIFSAEDITKLADSEIINTILVEKDIYSSRSNIPLFVEYLENKNCHYETMLFKYKYKPYIPGETRIFPLGMVVKNDK